MLPSIATAIIAGSPDAVLVLDADGRYQEANPAACQLLGYARDELLQLRSDAVVPEDAPWLAVARTAYRTEGSWRGEVALVRKDGTLVPVEAWSVLIPSPDGPLAVSFLRDLTDQKRGEAADARLAALVQASADAIMSLSLEGRIIEWNPAAERLYGYTAEEVRGQPVTIFTPPERAAESEVFLERLRAGEAIAEVETVRRTKDGRLIEVSLTAAPVRNAAGDVVAVASMTRDITARKQQETTLRQSEERFRTAFEHTPIGMALVSLDGHYLQVNAALCALIGYAEAELLARTFHGITHPDDLEPQLAQIEQLLAGEIVSFQMEKRYLRKDGEIVWVRASSSLIRDEHGAPHHFIGQVEDITARKHAEDALRVSESRYRTLVEHLPAVAYQVGVGNDSIPHYFSPYIETLTGETAEEAAAFEGHWLEWVHPEDQERVAAEEADATAAGEVFRSEYRRRRNDGSYVWIWDEAVPRRDEKGQIVGWQGILLDIAERVQAQEKLREAEVKYRALVEQLPAVVYLVANDERSRPLFYNSYIETLTGQTAEEAVARTDHWLDRIHPEDRERANTEGERALAMGEAFRAEYRYYRADGSYTWVRDECVPLRDDAGQIIAWQGVMFDISERKLAEEELRSAMEAAQAVNRAKGVFLDLMSHELRTPLQAVLGYSEFLLIAPKDSLTDAQREDIGYIHQAGGRMLALINQVLDLSRMEAGGIDLAAKPFDLGRVIEAVRQDIAPQAGAKGLAVEITLPPSLPHITGDAERVRQILLNLAGNAVKFTQQGHIRITASSAASGGVMVEVSDTGIGIPAEALPHIFEAFQQVESGLTRRHQGSGLGLAIAWRLAQQMGGSISVSSEPGAGSTFTLHLPERASWSA